MKENYVIGVDFGTDSIRSIVVDTSDGREVSSVVSHYKRWREGKYCDPSKNQFRQHPLDYLEGMETSVRDALARAPSGTAQNIVGLTVDTTGSTPGAVDQNGSPLALTPGFEENPNAMFILWKDHTAVEEAAEINRLSRSWGGMDYTKYSGGVYSSEWFWSKILHVLRIDEDVRRTAYSWVEHCDWIPALLTGNTDPLQLKRSRCAAGHKAMWHESFDGLPSANFLVQLDPLLKGLRNRLYEETYTCDVPVGPLTPEWAKRLNLNENVVVGVGAFDAHLGAVGGQIEPYILSKVIGTSTCDMLVAPMEEMGDKLIKGICGQVDGSIVPGMLGMEAGQSAFGDIYAWFQQLLMWPVEVVFAGTHGSDSGMNEDKMEKISGQLIPTLSREAEKIPIDESGVFALDWMNGRRTPDANQLLKGVVAGISLGSDAPTIFRALVEATAFGARKIVDRFISEGVPIHGMIALGGIPKKSPFVMQVLADVLNTEIKVARSEQAVALGSAMAAATVAGIYDRIEDAQAGMGSGFEMTYHPIPEHVQAYQTLFEKYTGLGDYIERTLT